MPSLTDAKRKTLYAALAALLFIILAFALVATALTEWSRNKRATPQTSTGLWGGCTDSPDTDGWVGATCTGFYNSGVCNGWYQAARAFACIAVAFAVLSFCIAIALALLGLNKALAALLVCTIFVTWFSAMMAFVSWILLRKPSCTNTDGQDLGASFILMVFAFALGLLAMCLAAFLMIAKPAEEVVISEYVEGYPAAYPVEAGYPAYPAYYPTVY